MRRAALGCLLLSACVSVPAAEAPGALDRTDGLTGAPLPPSSVYPGLFQAVAMTALYEPKDWVDVRPLGTPDEIMAAWRAAGEPEDEAALAAFTDRWFEPPAEVAAPVDLAPGRTLAEHVDALWPVLIRERNGEAEGSLMPLPNPYVVPGGRFREVYYWDAYFTMTGMGPEHEGLKRDMVDNFASQLEAYGRVPNANRSYYLSRSQPPFFHAMVGLLNPDDPGAAYAEYGDALRAEHAFWTTGEREVALTGGALLSRYYDDRDAPRDESYRYDVATAEEATRPTDEVYRDLRAGAESGWDYSSRWFADGVTLTTVETTDIGPVDLNAILFGLERAIEMACTHVEDYVCEAEFNNMAEDRLTMVQVDMWDEGLGAYVDRDLSEDRLRRQVTAATVYPLFFGAATQAHADRVAETVRAELLAPGGLVTTTVNSGEQWDAPNGWAPLQWLAVLGLERYDHDALAFEIARRWTSTVARGFCESGKLVEKYDVVTAQEGGGGEYPNQDGFGWTNGVTMALIRRDARLAGLADVPEMTDAPEACEAVVETALRAADDAGANAPR